jgi:hypothetical protein
MRSCRDDIQLINIKGKRRYMAGLLTDEQLVRELRVLYANKPMQFNRLIIKYYKGERAKQIIDTLRTWPT